MATFFKDGEVSFELPNDWPSLTTGDGSETSAKVTATVPDGDDTDGEIGPAAARDDVATDDIDFNGREIVVKVSALGDTQNAWRLLRLRIMLMGKP